MQKKILKGCLIFVAIGIGLIILIGIVAVSSDSGSNSTTKSNQEKDSINVVSKAESDSIELAKEVLKKEGLEELKSFRVNNDEFENSSFYRDRRTPSYANENFIYPYIGEQNGQYWLRLKFQYAASEWLFIQKAIILADGQKFEIYGTWEKDHDSDIWEWLDLPVTESEYLMLDDIANAKDVKIRYEGSQYRKDRTITSKEKDIIKKTLDIYDKLK